MAHSSHQASEVEVYANESCICEYAGGCQQVCSKGADFATFFLPWQDIVMQLRKEIDAAKEDLAGTARPLGRATGTKVFDPSSYKEKTLDKRVAMQKEASERK